MATPVRKPIPQANQQRTDDAGAARETAREPTHTPDGRVIARSRSGNLVSRSAVGSVADAFYIDPSIIPPGWSWEWKNEAVLGQTSSSYQAQMQQVGWEPVMLELFPGVFDLATNSDGTPKKGPVRRQGMILMERDLRLTKEAQNEERRKANEKVNMATRKHGKLDTSGAHGVDVNTSAVQRNSYVSKSIEDGANIPRPTYERIPVE